MDDPCAEDLNYNSDSYESEASENNLDPEEIDSNEDCIKMKLNFGKI